MAITKTKFINYVRCPRYVALDDLKKVTGYVRGGCSPIGMKRQFPTIIDRQVEEIDAISVSGGARGTQIKIDVAHLIRTTRAKVKKVTHDEHN